MSHEADLDPALRRLATALDGVITTLSGVSAELRAVADRSPGQAFDGAGIPAAPASSAAPPQQQPWPQPAAWPHQAAWQPPPPPYGQAPVQPPPYGAVPPAPRPPRRTLSDRLSEEGAGSRLLVWIGGAVTLVGVVLMLILAIQRGWIGPVPRVLIGAVLASGLVGFSLRAHRTPAGHAGAFALAATGIAALYLDIIAATALLDLLPAWLGLLVGLAVAGVGLLLAARWDAQPLAVSVLLGCALCAPVVTEGLTELLLGFLLVLQLASVPVQLARGWMWVPLASGLPPVVVALAAAPQMAQPNVVGSALLVSLLTSAVAVLSASRRRDDDVPPVLLACAAAPTLTLGLHADRKIAAIAAIALAVSLVAVWALPRIRENVLPPRITLAAGGVAGLCLAFGTVLLLDGDAKAIALLGESMLLSYLATSVRTRGVLLTAAGFALVGTALAVATVAPPSRILVSPWFTPESTGLVLEAVAFAFIAGASLALIFARARIDRLHEHPSGQGVRESQLLGALTTLYGASGVTLSLALLVMPDRAGFLLGHAVVTVSWMIAALVLLHRGITRRGPRIAGFVLVGAALVKLVLFDLSALDGVARAATFLGAGLVLLGAGARYTKLIAKQETVTTG